MNRDVQITVRDRGRKTDTAGSNREEKKGGKKGQLSEQRKKEEGRTRRGRETRKDRSDTRVRPELSSLSVDDALYFPLILPRPFFPSPSAPLFSSLILSFYLATLLRGGVFQLDSVSFSFA